MARMMTRTWWVFAIRGLVAIVFGALASIWPAPTLTTLVFLFGAYALTDGVSVLIANFRADPADRRARAIGIIGGLGVVVGIATFTWPAHTAMSLLYLVTSWAVATGLIQVIAAIGVRREIDGEIWTALGGAASVMFGTFLIASPRDALPSFIWLVGMWSVVFGVSSLRLAARLRSIGTTLPRSDSLPAAR